MTKSKTPLPFAWIVYKLTVTSTAGQTMERAIPMAATKTSDGYSVNITPISDTERDATAAVRILIIDWDKNNPDDTKKAYIDIGNAYVLLNESANTVASMYFEDTKLDKNVHVTGAAQTDPTEIIAKITNKKKALHTSQKTLKKEWLEWLRKTKQNDNYDAIAHFAFLRVITGYSVLSDGGNSDMLSHIYNNNPSFTAQWWENAVAFARTIVTVDETTQGMEAVQDSVGVLALQMAGKTYPTGGHERHEQRGLCCVRAYSSMGDCDFMALTLGSMYEMLQNAFKEDQTAFSKTSFASKIIRRWAKVYGSYFTMHGEVTKDISTGKADGGTDLNVMAHAFGIIARRGANTNPLNLKGGLLCESTLRNLCTPLPPQCTNPGYGTLPVLDHARYVNVMAAYSGSAGYLTNMPGNGKRVPLDKLLDGSNTLTPFKFTRTGEFEALDDNPIVCICFETATAFLDEYLSI